MQVAVVSIDYDGMASAGELVAPALVDDVFTAGERRYCEAGRGLDRWAGRWAAKRAVAALLDVAEGDVEVLPGEHPPHLPVTGWCRLGHPPRVVVHGVGEHTVTVSITHDHGLAAAVAMTR